jgi:AraC family transcriptional regulator, exoenzyme S synthesis regulatory protein ExsA
MISLELFGHVFAECFTLDQELRVQREMRNDACLAYIQEGKQEIYSATQKLLATNNESILMKCGNYIASFKEVTPTSQFKSVVFHLDPEAIRKAFSNEELSFLRIDKSKVARDPALKMKQNELLDSFVTSMMPYFDNLQLANDRLLLLKLKELIYILSDFGNNLVVNQIIGTLYSPEEISFDEIISANIYNNLSIGELAHLTARSESTFKRDFKKWYSESPAKYFKTKRLEKSADLLMNTNSPVSEIAWECGFENPAHFSTSFLTFFGSSPKEYRDMN